MFGNLIFNLYKTVFPLYLNPTHIFEVQLKCQYNETGVHGVLLLLFLFLLHSSEQKQKMVKRFSADYYKLFDKINIL